MSSQDSLVLGALLSLPEETVHVDTKLRLTAPAGFVW